MVPSNILHDVLQVGSIVVGVDGSEHADRAVGWAAEEAHLTDRPLAIVHVERMRGSQERGQPAEDGIPPTQLMEGIRADSIELLRRARTGARMVAPTMQPDVLLRVGDPRQVMVDLAETATMVVLGSRGRGPVSSAVLGSVSVAVSRHASCPVAVMRPRHALARLQGVFVGTGGTSRSAGTLEAAFREASSRRLPLTVVYCRWEAIPTPQGWRAARPSDPFFDTSRIQVAELITGLRDKFPDVAVSRGIFAGHVDQCLADLSREYDLTVVGRHTRAHPYRVGSPSLTTSVLEQACGPVLVVPD